MDAKSRADFINSVASGESVPCPKCGTRNKPDSKTCITCGAQIGVPQKARNSAPAFEPAKEDSANTAKNVEQENVFAQGLPDWSIEPPQVMVRRR